MLVQLEKDQVPRNRFQEKSKERVFAEQTLEEFFEKANPGDTFEVTGFPSQGDALKDAERMASALRTELFYLSKRDQAKVFRRKERLFIEKSEPIKRSVFG